MKNRKLKIGDKVKIIDCSSIENYELGKIGTIIKIWVYEPDDNSYTVDMGRPRRPDEVQTSWYLGEDELELVNETGQLLFPFMSAMDGT